MPRSRKPRILIVDDDEDNRTLLAGLLASDYDVVVAAEGDEALEAQEAYPFDVVVTDIFMPVKDGLETIRQLHEKFPATSIIAMSGAHPVSVDYLSLSLEFGASRILRKPFEAAALKTAMQDVLASR